MSGREGSVFCEDFQDFSGVRNPVFISGIWGKLLAGWGELLSMEGVGLRLLEGDYRESEQG